ncbi:MAG: SAM-dependent chlorinase/fluorinase [Acidobacteriota bacterium]
MAILTLLTDFGLRDYYVAAVKGVVLSAAPDTVLVDISHDVPPGDVEAASFLLSAAAVTFPAETVHLAVVDPGVGSDRRILAVETDSGRFVGPDNGLLTPFLDRARRVVAVDRPDLYRPGPGATFHGRDRFAPVAAAWIRGVSVEDLGASVPDPVRLHVPAPRRRPEGLDGRVRHVDGFGNLVTDLPAEWVGDRPCVAFVGDRRVHLFVDHYEQIPHGQAALLVGSLGTLELSMRGISLAERWDVARNASVKVRFASGGLPRN